MAKELYDEYFKKAEKNFHEAIKDLPNDAPLNQILDRVKDNKVSLK